MMVIMPSRARRRRRRTLAIVGLALSLAGAPAAPAAETPGEEEPPPPTFREELSVTGRALGSEGATATVVERAEIEASGARTVLELLRHVPGVQVLSFGSRGGRAVARVRGGNSNFTLVLLDGIPLNNPTDLEGGTFDLSSLPADGVERIEVVRGPQSYFFGSSALAGVINVVSRRGDAPGPRVDARLEAGEASLLRAGGAVSGTAGRSGYSLDVGWEEEAERIAGESFEQLNVQGTFTRLLGEESSLRLSGRYADWQADDYQDASGGPVFGSGELRSAERRQASLGAAWSLGGGGRVRHALSGSVDRQEADVSSPGVAPEVPPSVEATRFTRLRLGWLTTVEAGGGLRASAGVEVEREEADNDSTLMLPPFLGGALSGDYRLERTTPGAFAELALERGDLVVEAGLRADLPEDAGTEWSPRLGFRYRFPGRGALVHGSWSQAFKLPSFFALASPRELGGNPDLRPEESAGVDLGVELESAAGDLGAGLTVFRNRYENLIDFDFDLFQNVNRSSVEAEGVELFARWRPAPVLALAADLYRQELDDPGSDRPLLNQPEWIAGARLEWTPAAAVRLWLDGRYVGSSRDRQIPVPGRDAVDDYTVFDLALGWEHSARWEVTVRVDNLTDESYEHFIGFPEPGRSVRAGVRYRAGSARSARP